MISTSAIVTPPSSASASQLQVSVCTRTQLIRGRGRGRAESNSNPQTIFNKFNSVRSISAPNLLFNGSHSIYKSKSKSKPIFIVMEMQDCTVKKEVDVPASVAYNCYSDREAMAQWMPFISSVQVLKDKPDLSRWTLKYKAFGRDIEFSWLARNLQPIPNQKIHWRSLEGLPNSGAVRFYPKGPSSCLVELTVSYEVPQILVPVASALQPFLQNLLLRGLERFTNFAKSYQPDSTS